MFFDLKLKEMWLKYIQWNQPLHVQFKLRKPVTDGTWDFVTVMYLLCPIILFCGNSLVFCYCYNYQRDFAVINPISVIIWHSTLFVSLVSLFALTFFVHKLNKSWKFYTNIIAFALCVGSTFILILLNVLCYSKGYLNFNFYLIEGIWHLPLLVIVLCNCLNHSVLLLVFEKNPKQAMEIIAYSRAVFLSFSIVNILVQVALSFIPTVRTNPISVFIANGAMVPIYILTLNTNDYWRTSKLICTVRRLSTELFIPIICLISITWYFVQLHLVDDDSRKNDNDHAHVRERVLVENKRSFKKAFNGGRLDFDPSRLLKLNVFTFLTLIFAQDQFIQLRLPGGRSKRRTSKGDIKANDVVTDKVVTGHPLGEK